jgi:hypothetical protein
MNKHIDNAVRMLGNPPVVSLNGLEDQVIDAVTDLIHLCDYLGIDWERVTDQAEWHYEQEAAEGEVK